jgi:hypothetical protein
MSKEAIAAGTTEAALRWGERTGRFTRICRGVYADGPGTPTPLEREAAAVLSVGRIAGGALAGVLLGLDGVKLDGRPVPRRQLPPERCTLVDGIPCGDGLPTLVDLAATLDDLRWEQALESALRRRLTTVDDLQRALPDLGRARTPGTSRIRRVLALRPAHAPATESLLETLMVQLIRTHTALPDPERQVEVRDAYDQFVARVDLAWPQLGMFVELDGQHHTDQPVYDARRETAVVAATGWRCGRFTWTEVVRHPRATVRRIIAISAHAPSR